MATVIADCFTVGDMLILNATYNFINHISYGVRIFCQPCYLPLYSGNVFIQITVSPKVFVQNIP